MSFEFKIFSGFVSVSVVARLQILLLLVPHVVVIGHTHIGKEEGSGVRVLAWAINHCQLYVLMLLSSPFTWEFIPISPYRQALNYFFHPYSIILFESNNFTAFFFVQFLLKLSYYWSIQHNPNFIHTSIHIVKQYLKKKN